MIVLLDNISAEIVEKKSRFIADLFFVNDEKEAGERLNEIKKKYYDAKHHCFAYVIGEKKEIVKSSDDGEPKGTAGHPILDILTGLDLRYVISIVTRYFGGTLLGTGGLVSAYSTAVKEAIKNAKFAEVKKGYILDFDVEYDDYNKIMSYVAKILADDKNEKKDIVLPPTFIELKKEFERNVSLSYLIDEKYVDIFITYIRNLTKGNVLLVKDEKNGRKYIWKNLSPYYLW